MSNTLKTIFALLAIAGALQAKPVVTVNGVDITEEDIQRDLMMATQGQIRAMPPQKQLEWQNKVINERINVELIFDNAKKEKLLNNKDYKEALARELERAKHQLERQLAVQLWLSNLDKKITISDKDLKKYYNENTHEFKEPEKVHARHILLKEKAQAEAVIKKLSGLKGDALKNKFIELAQSESTGPSKTRGGDVGKFSRDSAMAQPFKDASFSLSVGGYTKEPVQSQFGFHVIYLEGKDAAKQLSYEEAKPYVERRMKPERFVKARDAKMKSLFESANIVDHTPKQ
jgi:parvulin-like peptidyl-prolyl isomerase